MLPPLVWLPQMTDFTKDLLAKDEGPESVVLMLETEFWGWQGQSEELRAETGEMESNPGNTAELDYHLYKKYKQQEADEIIENWSWWHPELEGGSRVVRHR